MGFARKKLKKIKQISFFKLFGSGIGEGFTPYPNTSVYAIHVWNNNLGEAENNIEAEKYMRIIEPTPLKTGLFSFLQFQAKVIGIRLTHLSPIKTNSRKKTICWPH